MAKLPRLPVLNQPVVSGNYRLPRSHQPVVFVPTVRGARCTTCRWVTNDLQRCRQPDYIRFMGTDLLPGPAWEICSDWWEGVVETDEDDLEDL